MKNYQGGKIKGYRNINDNKVISVEQYNELLEREALEYWKMDLEFNKENYETFENFKKQFLEKIDTDFEAIEE